MSFRRLVGATPTAKPLLFLTVPVFFRHLGQADYQQTWDLQESLLATTVARKQRNWKLPPAERVPTENHLLFCEHPPVYTLGRNGKAAHLLLDETRLAALGARFYHINRGGDITFHGPGQLVAYPILDLDHFFPDIHEYLRRLEEAVIRTLADFSVVAGRIAGLTGVWLDHEAQRHPRKICAMGVKTSRWVTMHGLALNVNTDLRYFDYIVPCGIADKAVTSLAAELGREAPLADVASRLQQHLGTLFGMHFLPMPDPIGISEENAL